MRWRRTIRCFLHSRPAYVWGAATLLSVVGLLGRPLLTELQTSWFRSPPTPSGCRHDMAVNVLPPMPATDSEMVLQLFRYLTRPHPRSCHKRLKMGGGVVRGIRHRYVPDGHKYVCMDSEQLDLPKTDSCLVYSIGINNEWSFDDNMSDFGCRVFAFDPSMKASRTRRGDRILFEPVGVGGRDETNSLGWHLLTLDSLTEQIGHTANTIHFLKMDVEGAEWQVLEQQAARGRRSTLARVEQLGIELHFLAHLPPERHTIFYRDLYRSLLALQRLGFYPFSFEENLALLDWVQIPGLGRNLTTAMEVVWLRSNCALHAAGA